MGTIARTRSAVREWARPGPGSFVLCIVAGLLAGLSLCGSPPEAFGLPSGAIAVHAPAPSVEVAPIHVP